MKRDKVISRVVKAARRQGGVITWRGAEREGATKRLVGDLVQAGVLRRPLRGVYVLAGAPDDHATRLRCAVAVGGPGAVASHLSAGWLQGLIEEPPAVPEVTAMGSRITKHPGIRMHSSWVAVPAMRCKGIACTTPLRTLVDLAAELPVAVLDGAIDKALSLGIVRLRDLAVASSPGTSRRGQARLRSAVKQRGLLGGPEPSVLESRMCRLLERHGLKCLKAEVVAGPNGRYRIDFACENVKLALEAYGYASHHTPEQLARDLERQAKLTGDGWTFLAYTWVQIEHDGERVAAEIAATHSRLSATRPHSR